MVIRFYCGCGKRLSAPDGTSGRSAKCPLCGARVLIPEKHAVEEEIPMAAPQKPAQEVIFEEPAHAVLVQPLPSAAPPPAPLAEALAPLRTASRLGLIVTIAAGIIACFATTFDAVAHHRWDRLILLAPELLLAFLLIGLLGYVCSRGGVRRLGQLAGEVRDRTLPLALAVASLIAALICLWEAITGMLQPQLSMPDFPVDPPIVGALSLLGLCVAFVLVALIWRRPETIGAAVRDDAGHGRWSFLEAVLSLCELGGKVAVAGGVILFGISGAFACIALLVSVIVGLARGAAGALAPMTGHLFVIGLLGLAPLVGYLALLASYGIAHTVRVWVAMENNTRKPAGQ